MSNTTSKIAKGIVKPYIVDFPVGDKIETRELRYDNRALIAIERLMDIPIPRIMEKVLDVSDNDNPVWLLGLKDSLELLKIGLMAKYGEHSDDDIDELTSGIAIQEIPTMVVSAIMKALNPDIDIENPDIDTDEGAQEVKNAQSPRKTSGKNSSGKPSGSAV